VEYVRELALTIAAVGGAVSALIAFIVGLWKARSIPDDVARVFRTRIEQWVDERRARVERERRMSTLLDLLPEIREQFQPNGGAALWDRVEQNGDMIREIMRTSDNHLQDSQRFRSEMNGQFNALPKTFSSLVITAIESHERSHHRSGLNSDREST
jgi:hypothetical protein